MRIPALALAIASLAAAPASAFVATNGLLVHATASGGFEVPYRGLSGVSDFWCAAGDYVIRDLGLAPTTRIFRTSAPPRRSGEGITFSLSPEGATKTGLAIWGGGNGVSASHARLLCADPDIIFE